jgi:DNA-3-methyladenine glycosylase I
MFEALTLSVFEAGLSWSAVFSKRDGFRAAFHDFDVAEVAGMTGQDINRLLKDPSIIRNRAKVTATADNARAMLSASPATWPLRAGCPAAGDRRRAGVHRPRAGPAAL